MKGFAEITLIGHVGHNPRCPSDKFPDFVMFPLAVSENWKDKQGEWQSKTQWYNCLTSQKGLSGIIRQGLIKGMAVFVTGTPSFNIYTAKDGFSKPSIEINISKFRILTPSKKEENESLYDSDTNSLLELGGGDFDEEIPF